MKKIILGTAMALAAVVSMQAQGLIVFANSVNQATRVSTNSTIGGASAGQTAAIAAQYYYALFYSATATTVGGATTAVTGNNGAYAFQDGAWSFAGDYATNTASLGRLFGGENADQSSSVQGVAPGGSARIVVVGWSANIGSTLAAVQAWYGSGALAPFDGWIGQSVVSGLLTFGDGALLPTPSAFGAAGPSVQGFTLGLIPVPEPSTFALAGLGVAALLAFRRRK